MSLTNAQAFMLYNILNNLAKEKFNIKTSFNIVRNIQILRPIIQSICAVRDSILSDFPKEGATIEQTQAVQSKFNDLENIKIELDLYKIKMSELESIQLTPQDVEFFNANIFKRRELTFSSLIFIFGQYLFIYLILFSIYLGKNFE